MGRFENRFEMRVLKPMHVTQTTIDVWARAVDADGTNRNARGNRLDLGPYVATKLGQCTMDAILKHGAMSTRKEKLRVVMLFDKEQLEYGVRTIGTNRDT